MSKKRRSKFGANVVKDAARREKAASSYGYLSLPKDLPIFKESEGIIKLDIIPYEVTIENHPDLDPESTDIAQKGMGWYKRPIWVHGNIGTSRESLLCPKTIGEKCPICEYKAQQSRDGVEWNEQIKRASLRNLYIVVPIGHKKYDEVFHLWDMSDFNFQQLLDEELKEDPDNGIFPDPIDGKTLKIRFSEEVFNKNKYYKATRIDFVGRKHTYDDDVIDEVPSLDELINVLSYKEIQLKFMEREEEEEDEETPSRKKKEVEEEDSEEHPFKRKKKMVVVEEEDPEEEDPEEEEDEKPRRKKRSLRRVTNSDGEEEDPEEEEEDEKPTRKRIVRKPKEEDPEEEDPEEVDPEEEDPVEEEEEVENPRRRKKREEEEGECPSGHTYGEEWDEHKDCDKCKLFGPCGDLYEKEFAA